MRFAIPVRRRLLLSLAAAHGVTDAATQRVDRLLLVYAAALLPIPGGATTAVFGVASVVHFAADLGDLGGVASLAMHGGWAAVCARWGQRVAFECALWYVCAVHIPLLARRLLTARAWVTLGALAAGSVAAAMAGPRLLLRRAGDGEDTFLLGHRLQRLVACHVALNAHFVDIARPRVIGK